MSDNTSIEIKVVSEEVRELRAENERLKAKVLLGNELASSADFLQVNHLKICFREVEQCFCGLQDLNNSISKYREASGSGRDE